MIFHGEGISRNAGPVALLHPGSRMHSRPNTPQGQTQKQFKCTSVTSPLALFSLVTELCTLSVRLQNLGLVRTSKFGVFTTQIWGLNDSKTWDSSRLHNFADSSRLQNFGVVTTPKLESRHDSKTWDSSRL